MAAFCNAGGIIEDTAERDTGSVNKHNRARAKLFKQYFRNTEIYSFLASLH